MERTISQEERIRRANEIYYRRNQNKTHFADANVRKQIDVPAYKKAKKSMTKKLVAQSVICIIIYFVAYYMQGSNMQSVVNFDDLKQKINSDANVDVLKENFFKAKDWVLTKLNGIVKETSAEQNLQDGGNNQNVEGQNQDGGNNQDAKDQNQEQITNEENVAIQNVEEQIAQEPEEVPKTQEEIDIEAVKSKSIIWPLNGVITSGFGAREGSNIVSSNHKGLDIAGNTGDNIIAAMTGTVTLASLEGDYRTAFNNRKWRCFNFVCSL